MNDKVNKVTKTYLEKSMVDYLMSPTLSELFKDYKPKWNGTDLIWYKKKEND